MLDIWVLLNKISIIFSILGFIIGIFTENFFNLTNKIKIIIKKIFGFGASFELYYSFKSEPKINEKFKDIVIDIIKKKYTNYKINKFIQNYILEVGIDNNALILTFETLPNNEIQIKTNRYTTLLRNLTKSIVKKNDLIKIIEKEIRENLEQKFEEKDVIIKLFLPFENKISMFTKKKLNIKNFKVTLNDEEEPNSEITIRLKSIDINNVNTNKIGDLLNKII